MILKKPVIGAHGATDWSVVQQRGDELGGGTGGERCHTEGRRRVRGGMEEGGVWR